MDIVVQKFGGTSLNTPQMRRCAVNHILRERALGRGLVVVVSAMGRQGDPYATDTLLHWVNAHTQGVAKRERDLLLHCGEVISAVTLSGLLLEKDVPSTVLTGWQAGVVTDANFTEAKILSVRTERMMELLSQGRVVIVAGFQGVTSSGEVTTLGRGGSDTSAAAIGASLGAAVVDIFTDVEGLMTADPKIVVDAQPLPRISYAEMANLAYQGAKVIHPRAVEVAMQAGVPLRIRATTLESEGTLVTQQSEDSLEQRVVDRPVTGITYLPHLTQIRVMAQEGEYDLQLKVFKTMAQHEISVDFINVNPASVVFTVFDTVADEAVHLLRQMGLDVLCRPNCAKVSAVGSGMAGMPGVMAGIVEALVEQEIPILQSSDSHSTIWVLVRDQDMSKAICALHNKFALHETV